MKPEEIKEHLAEINEEAIIYDNLEEHISAKWLFGMGIKIYKILKNLHTYIKM